MSPFLNEGGNQLETQRINLVVFPDLCLYCPQSLPFVETKKEFPQSHSTMQRVQMSNFWDAKLLNNLSAGHSSHPDANSRQLRGFCDQARLAQIEFTLN